MVAELSNPAFRDKLKSRNLWQRIIDSIANLFGFRKDSSNYAKISKNLSKIIDNYDTNFTKNYENIESNFTDFAKKNTIESKDSNQGKNMTKFEYTTDKTYSYKDLRDTLQNNLQNIIGKDIQNEETGIIARITQDEINKMKSTKALEKSQANGFSKEEHFMLCNDIENLFIKAKFKEKHPDYKGRKNITTYRFNIKTTINNKPTITKITAFIKKEGHNKIYTLELESIEKSSP